MTTKELSTEDLIDLADKDSYEFSWIEVKKVIYELLKSRDELQEVRAEIESLKAERKGLCVFCENRELNSPAKCRCCGGYGLIGNIEDTVDCPLCRGEGVENHPVKTLTEEVQEVLVDVIRLLESQRIWNGMGWHYNLIPPFSYLPVAEKVKAILRKAQG